MNGILEMLFPNLMLFLYNTTFTVSSKTDLYETSISLLGDIAFTYDCLSVMVFVFFV